MFSWFKFHEPPNRDINGIDLLEFWTSYIWTMLQIHIMWTNKVISINYNNYLSWFKLFHLLTRCWWEFNSKISITVYIKWKLFFGTFIFISWTFQNKISAEFSSEMLKLQDLDTCILLLFFMNFLFIIALHTRHRRIIYSKYNILQVAMVITKKK